MRLILIFVAIVTQSVLTPVGLAQTVDDCKADCLADKQARDMDCPSPYDASSSDERTRCLKVSQDAYSSYIQGCQPASPPETSSPPPPMGY